MRVIDRIGKKYHQLLIVSISHKIKNLTYVNTICDCGKEKIICLQNIVRTKKPTKSCNHLKIENLKSFSNKEPNFKSEYKRWLKNDVKSRNKTSDLTIEQYSILIMNNCHYCNSPGTQIMHFSQAFKRNGIDRIDNNIGYTINNCVSCCSICNFAKRSSNYDDFINWVEKVYNNKIKSKM